ncbi:MAG: hypothetical protein H6748_03985 [Spirochaetaceae bacterium]|nr:hypothetical protein [Myxococcales bacterium]MCB9723192.1 hypothetical protein [Spirochaetaceae bacterium]HPG26380.1 hypothetical protein [Myxococcota bacterium]
MLIRLHAGFIRAILQTLVLSSLLASMGCAGASFKSGASPDQIARDERECRSPSEAHASYESCMRERGYVVVDGDQIR